MIPTGAMQALLAQLDAERQGRPIRRHGRCTCRNNPSWPSCSLCLDHVPCDGCEFCKEGYWLDPENKTHKGKPHCLRPDCAICKSGDFCGRERNPDWYK